MSANSTIPPSVQSNQGPRDRPFAGLDPDPGHRLWLRQRSTKVALHDQVLKLGPKAETGTPEGVPVSSQPDSQDR